MTAGPSRIDQRRSAAEQGSASPYGEGPPCGSLRHAWLQKHPSPVARSGEFHWYPAEADRDLRASCVERLRGVEPPAVLWELAPGRVVWAQPFAAIAPHDKRRYHGLVLTIIEHAGAAPAALLAQLVMPRAVPWVPELGAGAGVRDAPELAATRSRDVAGVARALLAGGVARVDDPSDPALAGWVASIERWMPDAVTARIRRGTWAAGGSTTTQPDRIAELVAAAWRDPSSSAARAWRLVVELAEARAQTVDEIGAELAGIDALGALSEAERKALPGDPDFVAVLHAWGRGRFDQCPTAGTLTVRLADAVALRVLAHLVDGRDERAAVAEARWYALLPAARRRALFEIVAARAVSLQPLVTHG